MRHHALIKAQVGWVICSAVALSQKKPACRLITLNQKMRVHSSGRFTGVRIRVGQREITTNGWVTSFAKISESFLSVVEEMSGRARRESTELLSHFSDQNAECKHAAGRTTSPSVCWCNMITSLLQSDTSSPSVQCRTMSGAGKRKKAEGKNSSGMIRGINPAQQQAAAERAGHKHTNTIESLTRSNPIHLKIIRWFLPDPNE